METQEQDPGVPPSSAHEKEAAPVVFSEPEVPATAGEESRPTSASAKQSQAPINDFSDENSRDSIASAPATPAPTQTPKVNVISSESDPDPGVTRDASQRQSRGRGRRFGSGFRVHRIEFDFDWDRNYLPREA